MDEKIDFDCECANDDGLIIPLTSQEFRALKSRIPGSFCYIRHPDCQYHNPFERVVEQSDRYTLVVDQRTERRK